MRLFIEGFTCGLAFLVVVILLAGLTTGDILDCINGN
jgi:hypothetical protein